MSQILAGESDAVIGWLESVLFPATGLHVFEDRGAGEFPVIVASLNSSSIKLGSSAQRIWSNDLWNIQVRTKGSSIRLAGEIAQKIEQEIAHSGGSDFGTRYRVESCTLEQRLRYSSEDDEGNLYRHRGGLYRIVCRTFTS